jgi:hypothetical protein
MTGTCQEDYFLPAESFLWGEDISSACFSGRKISHQLALAASALLPPGAVKKFLEWLG